MLLEIARLPDAPSCVSTLFTACIVTLPSVSTFPLLPVTLNLLVFIVKSFDPEITRLLYKVATPYTSSVSISVISPVWFVAALIVSESDGALSPMR